MRRRGLCTFQSQRFPPGLYSGSESNATAGLFAPFPANNISDEISQVKNEAAGHYLDDLTTEAL